MSTPMLRVLGCAFVEFTHLGRSGLSVSRLCLGTMNFGPETEEADSFSIMDRAHEVGINFIDTADVYGWKEEQGSLRESSDAGSLRAARDVAGRYWRPRFSARWAAGPTRAGSRPCTFVEPATPRYADCRPTTSTCTRCTT